MSRKRWVGISVLALLAVVAALSVLRGSGIPFTEREQVWGVGIFKGDGPLTVSDTSSNPVVAHGEFGDRRIIGVADPWLLVESDSWYLFYEIIVRDTSSPNNQHAVLAVSTSEDDGATWAFQGRILEKPWHLSWPQVFEHEGDYFLVPESLYANQVVLYRAQDFPLQWAREAVLLNGAFTDPTLFQAHGRWWMLASQSDEAPDDTLRLFHSEQLAGPYVEHPASPVVSGDFSKARSAGPVIATPEGLVRLAQDHTLGYGRSVRAFLITMLTTTEYAEREVDGSPVLTGSGRGWNRDGMHHLVPVQLEDGSWVAAVDGFYYRRAFGLDR